MKVAVIGGGTMGNGIVHVFAQHGHDVTLIDLDRGALDRALATIAKNLDRQVKKGALSEADKDATLRRIAAATDLAAAPAIRRQPKPSLSTSAQMAAANSTDTSRSAARPRRRLSARTVPAS